MAVTSIWPIKGRVDRVINYARNPEKTTEAGYAELATLHTIDNVVEYAADEMKTEQHSYVSCINLRSEQTAAKEFMQTKRQWGKLDGRACYHGYQSFKADEVTAETAHEIGVKLANELWGDRFEVVVATHCNTGHYHTHFVINSVSLADGYKFYNSPADYAKMREVSDRLCREYGLSIIEHPKGKSKSYAEWQAERDGKPTQRSIIRADIDRAIRASTTERDFIRVMTDMGYELKTRGKDGEPLKYPALKPPDAKGYFRFHRLGEGYALEQVRERILQNVRKQAPFPEAEQQTVRCYRVHERPRPQITGLRALYFRYCCELHIIVKHPTTVSSPQSPLCSVSIYGENCAHSLAAPLPTKSATLRGPRRVSFLLREDIAKLDRLDKETLFLGKNRIETIGELTVHRKEAETKIEVLTSQRQELRKELRRLARNDDPSADEVRTDIAHLSNDLRRLRKEVSLCDSIAQRSERVRENLNRLTEQKDLERRESEKDELFRRRGGTGRETVSGGR